MDSVPPASPPPPQRRRRGTGQVTIREVAGLAGVSAMTVSRALKAPSQVSPAVLERVRGAVAQTGYLPNLDAGALSSGKSRLVAAVVPSIATLNLHSLLESLGDGLEARGLQMLLGQTGYDGRRRDSLLETVLARRPAGIVFAGPVEDAAWSQRLRNSGVPVMETWDLVDDPVDMLVGFSHTDMARAVVAYLHGRGRRRLALLGADDRRSQARALAFSEAAHALGLRAPVLQATPAPASMKSGREALAGLLRHSPQVDAVFCSSDLAAMGVLAQAQAQGIRVPDQLAVIGCGDLPFAADVQPALSTVHLDGGAMGTLAAAMLADRIEDRVVATPRRDLGFSIVQRASS